MTNVQWLSDDKYSVDFWSYIKPSIVSNYQFLEILQAVVNCFASWPFIGSMSVMALVQANVCILFGSKGHISTGNGRVIRCAKSRKVILLVTVVCSSSRIDSTISVLLINHHAMDVWIISVGVITVIPPFFNVKDGLGYKFSRSTKRRCYCKISSINECRSGVLQINITFYKAIKFYSMLNPL